LRQLETALDTGYNLIAGAFTATSTRLSAVTVPPPDASP